MIARHWKSTAKPGLAAAYEAHLLNETFPEVSKLPGFISARILKRDVESGVEFLIITEWETLSSIKAFAGEDVETAVVPETVRAMMARFDEKVIHYDVEHEFSK
jgi:heme-degrading monooxygenase HmoA